MAISFACKASVPPGVLMEELEGESVFLNLKSGMYFGLNDVGTRMWKALTTSASIECAFENLLTSYDVDPEALRKDIRDLLEKLIVHGMVEIK